MSSGDIFYTDWRVDATIQRGRGCSLVSCYVRSVCEEGAIARGKEQLNLNATLIAAALQGKPITWSAREERSPVTDSCRRASDALQSSFMGSLPRVKGDTTVLKMCLHTSEQEKNVAQTEFYRCSATGKQIPLSFTGRYLMQKLRHAIVDAIKGGAFDVHDNQLSRVRGDVAEYMSRLEGKRLEKRPAVNIDPQPDLMLYDPTSGISDPYPSHALQYREYHGNMAWLYNPWTGVRRDPRDIGVDPFGRAIIPTKA